MTEPRARIAYQIICDGYILHPEGELLIDHADWEKHKTYHVAMGCHFIDCNATGGEPEIAKQMLNSKGIQWVLA